jgi:hypothetical protein
MRALFVFAGVSLFACTTTTTSSSPSSSTNPTTSTLDDGACQSRCAAKAESCGGAPDGYCTSVCSNGLTDEQMTCLEGKACSALASGDLEALCPRSSSSTSSSGGSSSGGSSSGGSSSGSTSQKSVGDACTCEKYGSDTDVYRTCIGNATACFDIGLACLAVAGTGKGVCVVTCPKANLGEKCASGGTCTESGKKALNGDDWTICE